MLKGKSLLVVLVLCVLNASLWAIELDMSLSADVASRYVWRGQNLGHTAVLQPSATIGKSGFSFNAWGNMPLSDVSSAPGAGGRRFTFNEVDFTLDYSGDLPGSDLVDYSAGFILYTFPSNTGVFSAPSVHELYLGFSFDTLLSPSITFYRDTNITNGWYVNGGVGHSVELDESLALDLGASLGWGDSKYNNAYWTAGSTTPGAALNDLVLSAALPLAVGNVSIVPSLSYVTLVESKIRSSNGFSGKSDFFVAGVGVAAEF